MTKQRAVSGKPESDAEARGGDIAEKLYHLGLVQLSGDAPPQAAAWERACAHGRKLSVTRLHFWKDTL
jgi:hypothetical protein